MNRNITGTIRKTDGAVWTGAVLEFELERSSYDESAQYPTRPVRAVANEAGELTVSLWVNEEALRPSRYICTLPDGSQFRFTLPTGFGSADLNQLRETAVEEDSPTQNTLVAFLPVVRTEAQQIVDQAMTGINAEIDSKAEQSALNTTNANVTTLTNGLTAANTAIATKAAQSGLDSANASINALVIDLDSKAKQISLDATDANVISLTAGLASANSSIATKAAQSGLNTTNTNLAALTTVVGTKASQSALSTAISDLQDAISQAQTTLQDMIDQKSDVAHAHQASDVSNAVYNSIGYFNNHGILFGSDQLTYVGGKLGLGTDSPQVTLDLQQPNADAGNQSRMAVDLNNSAPVVQLTADPGSTTPPTINLECGGMINTIDSDAEGNLGFGTEGVTPAVIFRMTRGAFSFVGMAVGFDEPSDEIFPPLSWGFYKQINHFGLGAEAFYLVFHDGDDLQVMSFSGK